MFSLLPLFSKEQTCPLVFHLVHLKYIKLKRENKEARESGVLPSTHEISSLQFEIEPVLALQVKQDSVTRSLSRHILITGKR